MAYREDNDLNFLETLKSEELNILVDILIHDPKDGKNRHTERLTSNEKYKKFQPDHHQYWKEIAAEIQYFGGNTLVNRFRGKGVTYIEILKDVCKRCKVDYDKKSNDVFKIEEKFLNKVLSETIKKMSKDEQTEIASKLGINQKDLLTPQYIIASIPAICTCTGFLIFSDVFFSLFMKHILGRFLINVSVLGATTLPITVAWAMLDLVPGTAYRVTIPIVFIIASLRRISKRYSIALIGDVGVGKTTLLGYLRKGTFVETKGSDGEGQSFEEKYESFKSPLWDRTIETIIDVTGAKDLLRRQKELCKGKDVVFFCYKPQDVLENENARRCFLQRLEGIKQEKVFFIATYKDCYNENDMKNRMQVFFASPAMGSSSKLFSSEKSFYVNLTNEDESKNMLMQILNKMEESAHA